MPMIKADGILSEKIRASMPEDMKTIPYIKVTEGFIGTIVKVVYSTYEVLEKDANGSIVFEDGEPKIKLNKIGEPVLNTTAYIKWDNGSMGSVKTRTAIAQLISLTGEVDRSKVGVEIRDTEPCKVKIIMVKESYGSGAGKKDYPAVAFEPMD